MAASAKPKKKQSKPTTDPKQAKAKAPVGKVMVEYLQVLARVHNQTQWRMHLLQSNLSWGKWMQNPTDVAPNSTGQFSAQGFNSSPSGTEGYVSWALEGHGKTVITAQFNNPYIGSDAVSIECSDESVPVRCEQTRGNEDAVNYYIG